MTQIKLRINPNYPLHIPLWIVALILITSIAGGFIIYNGWTGDVESERTEKFHIQAQLNAANESLLQCNSKRIQDSIKNSINHTPNVPADEYMKQYKTVKK